MKKVYNCYKDGSEYPFAGFDTMREAEECAAYYDMRWGKDVDIRLEYED